MDGNKKYFEETHSQGLFLQNLMILLDETKRSIPSNLPKPKLTARSIPSNLPTPKPTTIKTVHPTARPTCEPTSSNSYIPIC